MKQFSVFLPNKVGAMLEIVKLLNAHHTHVVALSVSESTDSAIARIVVSDPEQVLANKELRARLHRAIDALSEPLRLAVLLHDVEGLSQKEIAAIMQCPLGTVKSRIQRGRSELRSKLAYLVEGEER